MKWAGYIARMGDRRGVYRFFLWGIRKERDRLEYPGLDGRMKLRWIVRKWDVGYGLDPAGSG